MLGRFTPRRIMQGIRRRISRRVAPPPRPIWRTVDQGPLTGLQFVQPPPSVGTWSERIVRGDYEADLLPLLQDMAGQGGTFYDIGGHIGFFTCAWLHLGGTHVVTFEPVPASAEIVRRTAARNGFGAAVQIQQLALGDYNGTATLRINAQDLGTSSMAFVEGLGGIVDQAQSAIYQKATRISTPVRRLDDLVAEQQLRAPVLLKLDVEGAEDRVLAGAPALIAAARPVIICEVHNIAGGVRLAHQLTLAGYGLAMQGKNAGIPVTIWRPISYSP